MPESNGDVLAGTNINRGKVSKMKFRFYKQTRWFEVYFERQGMFSSEASPLFKKRSENGEHEIWCGRFYLTFCIYSQRDIASA